MLDIFMKWFGCESSDNQSMMLNAFADGLFSRCKTDTASESQICWIAKGLDSNGKKLIKELNSFIKEES